MNLNSKKLFFPILVIGFLVLGIVTLVGLSQKPITVKPTDASTIPQVVCSEGTQPSKICPRDLKIIQQLQTVTNDSCYWVCKKDGHFSSLGTDCPISDSNQEINKAYDCPLDCTKITLFNGCQVCWCGEVGTRR